MSRRRRPPITTVVFDLDDTLYDCYRQRVLVAHRYANKKMLAAGLRRSTGRRLTIKSVFRLRLRLFRKERNLDTLDRRLCAWLGLQGNLAERLARCSPRTPLSARCRSLSPTVGGEAHVPFGGIKATGVGERETGSTAIDFYTELKVVYVDYTGRKREGKLY